MRQGQEGRALRQFTLSAGKSAGRNSSGRITVFHRGGGSKRLQRRIDLKRSTSSIGIVERIEYDPNRSSRIAPVRWIEGVQLRCQRKCNTIEEFAPPRKILEPTTTTIRDLFSFSSLPGKVDQRKVACFSPGLMAAYVVVGLPTRMPPWSKSQASAGIKKTCTKDVFFSALSSPKAKGETASLSFGSSFCFPRIAVAGAKPAFFAPRMREKVRGKNTFSLGESFRRQETLGLVGAAEHNELKPKTDQGSLPAKPIGEGPKDGACKVDRAPVVCYRGSKRGQAVTIERLSLSIPSHTGREVKWQGKAIRPFGSSRSIAHIQTSDWGTGQRPWSSGGKGRPARPHSGECRLQDYDYRGILVGRPTTTRTLYQVMSEAKPPPIGEGTKARRRLDLRKYENKYVKVTKSLSRLQRERRRHQLEAGKMVMNCDWSKPSPSDLLRPAQNAHTYQDLVHTANKGRVEGGSQLAASWPRPPAYRYEILDLNSQIGNCIPLADIRIGTWVHDIECNPGQGAKLARAAGTFAKIMKEPAPQCLVRLPSGVEKLIDSRCRATIGIVSNPNHGARKLRKVGQSRWLGRRPIVRGVAMNPVDHPHGGGEGRTK
ncbi:hypothetical protein HHK36_031946 [Tetracentron sinense]|uniref:60S ribosomal protein L2, mitochondrial n=1 Tax=Tetracentron sinense TaxID=13715 RepID=A0A834Y8R7_TETSI|nr:hypothetical protein HHK36_031946 [Tetracentron sinense]